MQTKEEKKNLEKATQFTGMLILSSVSSHWVRLAPALYSQGAPSSPQDRLTGYRTARGAGVCLGTLGWGEAYLSQLQDPSSLLT